MDSIDLSELGLGSGIQWSRIIDQELESYKEHNIAPLKDRQDTIESQMKALSSLRSKMSELSSISSSMDRPSEMKAMKASSSNEGVLTASAESDAAAGTHEVEVNQLADGEIETHTGLDEAETVVNNSGSVQQFAYTYDGQTTVVDVNPGATLKDLSKAINNDADNPGVTASVLDDGSGGTTSHHLELRGDDTGESYGITIDGNNTTLKGDWGNLTADAASGSSTVDVDDTSAMNQYQAVIVNDDDSAAEYHVIDSISSGTLSLQNTLSSDFTTGQNAYVTPRGIGSTVSSSVSAGATEISVSDAADFQEGKNIVLADGTNSEQLTISDVDTTNNVITVDGSTANDYSADAYVTQLEGGRKFTFQPAEFQETQAAQNAQVRVDGYPSGGWIERESNEFSDVIEGVNLELHSTTSGDPVTVTVNRNTDAVKEKVHTFVEKYNAARTFINEKTKFNEESGESGPLMGNYAARLIESRLRNTVISPAPGFENGSDEYTLLAQLGIETQATDVADTELGTLKVDDSKLSEALSNNYDEAVELLSEHFGGESNSDYLTFHQASDDLTEPGTYDVEVDFDGSGNITGARMKKTSESTFRDAKVDGNHVIGKEGNPEESLWVGAQWDGSSATQTAEVRVQQGVIDAMSSTVDTMLDGRDGILAQQEDTYSDIQSDLKEDITEEEEELNEMKEQLTRKYARLEKRLHEMQSQLKSAKSMGGNVSLMG